MVVLTLTDLMSWSRYVRKLQIEERGAMGQSSGRATVSWVTVRVDVRRRGYSETSLDI